MNEQKISDLADAILAEYDFLDGVSTSAEVYIKTKAIWYSANDDDSIAFLAHCLPPVEPKPPVPRSDSGSASTSSNWACSNF